MTDHDFMIAIYKGIEKIYLELTGNPLQIEVETPEGFVLIKDFQAERDLLDRDRK